MKAIFAIDPGPSQSAWVIWDGRLVDFGDTENNLLLMRLRQDQGCRYAIEWITYQGGRAGIGRETFETCYWIGRFAEALSSHTEPDLISRNKARTKVSRSAQAGDKEVRKALIDRFGPVGTKKNPGPLYGISSHRWAALAVAVTVFDSLSVNVKKETK